MAVIETWLQTDLKKPVQVKQLGGHLFSADNQGNLIGVVIKDNGIPAEGLSGGVFGYAIRPDNETVVIEGMLSGNRASILLPASCYAIVGPISIVIKLGTTTIGACTGNIYRTTTDTIVDPGSVIPDISELLAKIADCEAATVRANTASDGAEKVNASMSKSGDVITIAVTDRDGVVTEEELTDQSNAVTELEKAVVAQGIYIETESQPIVNISDGADGIPMRKVEVAIEPVQDLHGYDHPWPAGGGKNLLPGTPVNATTKGCTFTYDNGLVTLNGTASSAGGRTAFRTENFSLKAGTYTFKPFNISGTADQVYLQNGTEIIWGISSGPAPKTFTLESDYDALNIGMNVKEGTSYNYSALFGIFTDSEVAEWTPYSNVCPISGWTGVKVTKTGKNLLAKPFSHISAVPNSLDECFFLKAGTYTLSVDSFTGATSWRYGIRLKDASGNDLNEVKYRPKQGASWNTNTQLWLDGANHTLTTIPITLVEDCYVRIVFAVGDTSASTVANGAMLSVGSTALPYEPYQGQTYEVTFPSEAGTVYGGTLDVVRGKLVVDRAIVDLGTLNWSYGQMVGQPYYRFQATISNSSNPKHTDSQAPDMICSAYQTLSINDYKIVDKSISANSTSTTYILYVRDDSYTDTQAFKSAVSGVMLCYKSAEPIATIQLTQTEIKTLLGINNVWADAGNVAITYPADTKTYIDNRINSTRKLIAGIETGFVASKPYAVGDMLIIGDDLYKVASSIASGATITVGTNVTKTTVAEQLIALANA